MQELPDFTLISFMKITQKGTRTLLHFLCSVENTTKLLMIYSRNASEIQATGSETKL